MGFINEAKYRFSEGTTPPFFKKLRDIGATMITAGTAFAAVVPGVGTIIGSVVAGVGLGAVIAARFATKDNAEVTKVKAELQAVERKEEKESSKTNQ